MQIALGQIVVMKKKHPCGSFEWEVLRIGGADVKLVCQTCQRTIMLDRGEFEKRVKRLETEGA